MLFDLVRTRLTSLVLTLDYGCIRGSPAARFLEGLDLEGCAQRFARTVPSLQYVLVSIRGASPTGWEGLGEGGEEAEWLSGGSDDEDGDENSEVLVLDEEDDDGW